MVENRDPVGHRQRLALVVGDEDESDAERAAAGLQLLLHLLAQLQVERAQRLVEQQHLRLVDQRAGQRHALALAAGKLSGLAGAVAGKLHQLQRLFGGAVPLALAACRAIIRP